MWPDRNSWTDERVEQILGNLLRAGVILAAVVVFAGGVLYVIRHGAEKPGNLVFHGEPAELRSIPGIIVAVWNLESRGLIQLGLLLLLATPIARVVFSVIAFALEGDRTYVVITLIVLAVLIFSLSGGQL